MGLPLKMRQMNLLHYFSDKNIGKRHIRRDGDDAIIMINVKHNSKHNEIMQSSEGVTCNNTFVFCVR
jgi:hypothetical protein